MQESHQRPAPGLPVAGLATHGPSAPRAARSGWSLLHCRAESFRGLLTVPLPGGAGLCEVCRGPARVGCVRCYQCQLHAESAPAGLADLVIPIAYAPKGGAHARLLWQYKSGGPGAPAARAALRALALTFLHDHGRCVWQRAGIGGPTRLAVVPSGRGRPGQHPLRALLAPYLTITWAELMARPGRDSARELDPLRFAAPRLTGEAVLLVEDTWASGASAQSAAMVLREVGARSVIVVVLGRHLSRPGPSGGYPGRVGSRPAAAPGDRVAVAPFRPDRCAMHLPS